MFTVCPKCALTLVVTAADLRVAQGYVRCGRCSNVFNAIVGLSEDRSGGGSAQVGTATTSIIRKAPSIAEDDPARDVLSDTGETEAIYAEPEADSQEVNFQEVFVEAPQPAPASPPRSSAPASRASAPAQSAPPPRSAPPAQAPVQSRSPPPATQKSGSAQAPTSPAPPAASKAPPPQEALPAFSDSIPDVALEFNPEATDVTQVFIEAAPAKKIDLRQITGTFEQIKPPPESPPAPAPPPRQAAPRPQASPPPQPPRPPPRNREDTELEDELRTLAARLDATGKQPAVKPEPPPRSAPPKPERAPAQKRAASEDVLIYQGSYQGSPYNSAETPGNLARKAAASAAKRRLAPPPPPASSRPVVDSDEIFDAPPVDDAGAYEAAVSLTRRPVPRGRRLAWIGGAAALCVVLAAQAIHHNRHDLATNATLNRPLTKFYEAIGVPLVPRWNLALYDVRQLGAFSGGGDDGNLTVRASLKNTSDQILPLPLLRITVQDRYGNRIATRDVPPKGYVPGAVPDGAHLGVGQRIDAEMSFKDPGRDAVGFEIDACLPTPEGRIACASDAAVAPR